MSNLTKLVVGEIPSEDPMNSLLKTFSTNIHELENELTKAMKIEPMPVYMLLYGAYACRTLLESSFTALITRVDPLRILFLQAHQNSEQYEKTQRNKSAIQWTGDVLPKGKTPDKIWTIDIETGSWRAMLGDWQNKIIIEPSFKNLSDFNTDVSSDWLSTLMKINPEGIGSHLRGEAEKLYSELSKAVHAEYVIPRATVIDVPTVRDHISKTFQLIGKLALLSHFSSVPHGCLGKDEALTLFKAAEESINGNTTD